MRVTINNIERECQVCTPQRGTYQIAIPEEGTICFPDLLLVAPAITEDEKPYGDIIVCPIMICNGGYESVSPDNVHTYLNIWTLKMIINNYNLVMYDGKAPVESAEYFINRFVQYGTVLSDDVKRYIDNKEYITDEDIRQDKPISNGK